MQPGRSKTKYHVLVLALLAALLVAVAATVFALWPKQAVDGNQNQQTVASTKEKYKGVALMPRTKEAPRYDELFEQAPTLGGVLSWTGDWAELNKSGSGAQVLVAAASQYDFTPVVMVSLHSNTSPSKLLRPLTPELVDQYVQDAADFVQQHPLAYFGIGVEVNNLKKDDPEGYEAFVGLFNKTAAKVREVSPHTKVFTVFQLERTKGLNGGLFGGSNDESANTWDLLNDFERADVIGFTSYPALIYKDPAQIPEDYYSEIGRRTTKPIIFTETGWPSRVEAVGWDSSPALQGKFVDRFFELTKPINPGLVIWPFAYDPQVNHPFSSLGLADSSGQRKPAWDKWTSK